MDMDGPTRYAHLLFNSPCSSARADAIAAFVSTRSPRRVLDIGCGWGELLLRVLAASNGATARGVDDDAPLIERAQQTATARGLADRTDFVPTLEPGTTADVVLCSGASHIWGTAAEALAALSRIVEPGGLLIYGDGFWDSGAPVGPSAPEDMTELPDLAGLVDAALLAGFRPLRIATANRDEWEEFESGYAADREEWLTAYPSHPDAAGVLAAADEHRTMWLRGYREALGFAWLTLGKPNAS